MGIEGNPFITRFKTIVTVDSAHGHSRIEGNPFITRFKTLISIIYSSFLLFLLY